jgi:alpha-glucoside transport system substrate-binding protein
MSKHRWWAVGLTVTVVLILSGLAAVQTAGGAKTTKSAASGKISVMAVWTGAEQKSFQAVINGFKQKNPGVSVTYTSAGDQLPTVLATAIQGGNPPDVAMLPQPGLMKDFVKKGALKPVPFALPQLRANFAPVWASLGTVNGKLYGLIWKGANKSTGWYNVASFRRRGRNSWPQQRRSVRPAPWRTRSAVPTGGR